MSSNRGKMIGIWTEWAPVEGKTLRSEICSEKEAQAAKPDRLNRNADDKRPEKLVIS